MQHELNDVAEVRSTESTSNTDSASSLSNHASPHLASTSLVPRSAVELARRGRIRAHIDQRRLVPGVLVDAHDLPSAVRRHALDMDVALALFALSRVSNWIRACLPANTEALTVPQALYTLP